MAKTKAKAKKLTGEQKHLREVADALIATGYEVSEDEDGTFLGVWGYVTPLGGKRRKRCFEEIYCTIIKFGESFASYWSTNETYDNESGSIEIIQDYPGSDLHGISALIDSLCVEPIKGARPGRGYCKRCSGKCANASHRRTHPLG